MSRRLLYLSSDIFLLYVMIIMYVLCISMCNGIMYKLPSFVVVVLLCNSDNSMFRSNLTYNIIMYYM